MRTLIGVGIAGLVLCALAPSIHAQGGEKPAAIPPPAQIRAAMENYVKFLNAGDAENILTLYGDNPSVEDPVGKLIVGREAVRAFYTRAAPGLKGHVRLAGPVVVTGLEGAMPMVAEAGNGVLDVIDTMKFDTNGKIIVMRAYVSPR